MKEISSIILHAQQDPTSANLETMWHHVMCLPAWYFLPSALHGEATPLVAELDGGNWVVAFTHFRALNEFTRQNNMRSDTGEVPMLTLLPREAMERVAEVSDHIDGLAFNISSDLAFRAPTAALLEFAERLLPQTPRG